MEWGLMFGWALKMRPAANKFLRRSRCQRDILKTSNPVPRAEFSLSCSRTAVPEQFTAELSSAIVVDIIDESDGNRFVPIKGPATPCSNRISGIAFSAAPGARSIAAPSASAPMPCSACWRLGLIPSPGEEVAFELLLGSPPCSGATD